MGAALDRLNELKDAASDWFDKEKQRLQAQFDFLDAIGKARHGSKGLQNLNTEGASQILANSLDDYLGKPIA